MTEVSNIDVSKKLSTESKALLDELGNVSLHAAELVPRLYKSLEKDGVRNSEIFRIINEKIAISRRRLYELMPQESKRPYKLAASKIVRKVHNQAKLVTKEEPDIPPPPQVIQEVETEPPKPIDEPIHIPEHQITLNCRKFGTELRMGLLNNAILKLRIDKLNQVVSME